jgi:hypothetical protein
LNISALQERLALAGQRATSILGVIFSIVALASLASPIWIVLAGIQQSDREQDLAATAGASLRLDDWIPANLQLVLGVELSLMLLAGTAIWI